MALEARVTGLWGGKEKLMNLEQALEQTGSASKHVEDEIAGTYTVDKANLSAGYYKDFHPDDPAARSPFNTSSYWGYDYPGADPLGQIASFAGEDGWQPR